MIHFYNLLLKLTEVEQCQLNLEDEFGLIVFSGFWSNFLYVQKQQPIAGVEITKQQMIFCKTIKF